MTRSETVRCGDVKKVKVRVWSLERLEGVEYTTHATQATEDNRKPSQPIKPNRARRPQENDRRLWKLHR